MSEDRIIAARSWFAEELRFVAQVQSRQVIDGFATVPREQFSGAGPWRILSPARSLGYWTTENADPVHLYHNVLVAIDEKRRLNNGQPSLWAALFDQLDLSSGNSVIHVGTGTGYYTAILAHIVGAAGIVTGIEIDAELAARCRENLALTWPQASIITANGFEFAPPKSVNAIIVNAGVSQISLNWLDALAEGGRLLVPLTVGPRGAFLLIIREGNSTSRYSARVLSPTSIIPCVGGSDPEAEARLKTALQSASYGAIKSLRRPPETPDTTCWLAGNGWWLSTAGLPDRMPGGMRG